MSGLRGTVLAAGSGSALAGARVQAERTLLWLTTGLRAYPVPDTSSAPLGTLGLGDCAVHAIRPGPAKGADHVLVEAPGLPQGRGWICSRWRATHYALLHDAPVHGATATTAADGTFTIDLPHDGVHRVRVRAADHLDATSPRTPAGGGPVDAPLPDLALRPAPGAVPEHVLVGLLHHFAGWYYTPKRPGGGRFVPQYPYDIGVRISLDQGHPVPPTYDDCCSFVEALVVGAWKTADPTFPWDLPRHQQAMITGGDPYSSTAVLVEAGVAEQADPDALPAPWTVVQGWADADALRGGHTFLVADVHAETGRVLTLESNFTFWLNGPGMRWLGGIGRFVGTCWLCPVDGWVYDPAVGDPAHGVAAATPFQPRSLWDLLPGSAVPADWTCPGCGTGKARFVPLCRPPRDWWKSTYVPTWSSLCARYPDRRLARLQLRDLSWMS